MFRAAFFLAKLLEEMRENYPNIFGETNKDSRGDDEGDTSRRTVSGFIENWGWEYQVDLCAESERIPSEKVYFEWNVTQMLNRISYLQDRAKYERALNGIK